MFQTPRSAGQSDPGCLFQLLTACFGIADSRKKSPEKPLDAFLSRKIKGAGDPRPGMLVYRITRGQDRCQVLRIDRQELFGLRELRPRILHDDRQNDLPETGPDGQ